MLSPHPNPDEHGEENIDVWRKKSWSYRRNKREADLTVYIVSLFLKCLKFLPLRRWNIVNVTKMNNIIVLSWGLGPACKPFHIPNFLLDDDLPPFICNTSCLVAGKSLCNHMALLTSYLTLL